MDGGAGVVCAACAWFGVYRSDVAAQLAGCPNCGGETLVTRDLADPAWHDLGREFVRALPGVAPAPARGWSAGRP